MKFYIKQWADHSVSLMTELGDVLASFASVQEALRVCTAWNLFNEKEACSEIVLHDNTMSAPTSTTLPG